MENKEIQSFLFLADPRRSYFLALSLAASLTGSLVLLRLEIDVSLTFEDVNPKFSSLIFLLKSRKTLATADSISKVWREITICWSKHGASLVRQLFLQEHTILWWVCYAFGNVSYLERYSCVSNCFCLDWILLMKVEKATNLNLPTWGTFSMRN